MHVIPAEHDETEPRRDQSWVVADKRCAAGNRSQRHGPASELSEAPLPLEVTRPRRGSGKLLFGAGATGATVGATVADTTAA